MNPLTNVKNIAKLNERELKLGINNNCSWHKIYKDSPWIFIGGLDYDLTEGDVICVFSQYGEVEDINLVRDKKTGNSKGFCFLCYQNKTSTILAVDNLNGIKLCGRTIRVDHVADYRPPKESKNEESDEDSSTVMRLVQQDTIEDTKTRHKDKQYKSFIGDDSTEELPKEKHFHKSSKFNVPKEVIVNKGNSYTHHHQARDSSREKSHQGSSSKHFDKDSAHSSQKFRTERKFHSSSDDSIKHKLKKDKYNESKPFSRRHGDSNSDESMKVKDKYKESKPFNRRHSDSSSDESIKVVFHALKKDKYEGSKPFGRKHTDSSSGESSKVKHKLKKDKYKESKSFSRKQNHSDSSSDESDERTKHKNKHKKHKHKESRHKNSD